MADDLYDEVFVLENGIATNQNVPLILPHDLEVAGGIVGFGLGDEFPDIAAANNQIIHDDLGGNLPGMAQEEHPGFPGVQMPSNGLHLSMSSTQSSVPSFSSIAFEQGEVLGTSTPALDVEAGCYVNECYQSSTSDLSEFNPSVEIQPGTQTVSFKYLTKKYPGVSDEKENSEERTAGSTSSSENKATQTSTGLAETGSSTEVSTSALDDSEVNRPNPPNSPIGFGTSLSRSGSTTHLLRRYRNRVNPEVHQLNHPDRPSNLFLKFGSYLLILVLILLLAIIACLEGLLPRNCLTALLVFWALSIIGSIGCFVKACWEERDLAPDRPGFGSGYGSTSRTRPALSHTA